MDWNKPVEINIIHWILRILGFCGLMLAIFAQSSLPTQMLQAATAGAAGSCVFILYIIAAALIRIEKWLERIFQLKSMGR